MEKGTWDRLGPASRAALVDAGRFYPDGSTRVGVSPADSSGVNEDDDELRRNRPRIVPGVIGAPPGSKLWGVQLDTRFSAAATEAKGLVWKGTEKEASRFVLAALGVTLVPCCAKDETCPMCEDRAIKAALDRE